VQANLRTHPSKIENAPSRLETTFQSLNFHTGCAFVTRLKLNGVASSSPSLSDFEIPRLLVRFDHIALGIVNANHSIMRPAVEFYVADCIPDCVWAAIPQWAVWEHVAD
jgi:hypothetical protein